MDNPNPDDQPKTQKKLTKIQKDALLAYMEKHPKFAANQIFSHEGKAGLERLWQELTADLNKLTGPNKDSTSWKSTWKGLQKKARHAKATAEMSAKEPGNNVDTRIFIDSENQRILDIMGNCHRNGLDIIPESGIINTPSQNADDAFLKQFPSVDFGKASATAVATNASLNTSIDLTSSPPSISVIEEDEFSRHFSTVDFRTASAAALPNPITTFNESIDLTASPESPHLLDIGNLKTYFLNTSGSVWRNMTAPVADWFTDESSTSAAFGPSAPAATPVQTLNLPSTSAVACEVGKTTAPPVAPSMLPTAPEIKIEENLPVTMGPSTSAVASGIEKTTTAPPVAPCMLASTPEKGTTANLPLSLGPSTSAASAPAEKTTIKKESSMLPQTNLVAELLQPTVVASEEKDLKRRAVDDIDSSSDDDDYFKSFNKDINRIKTDLEKVESSQLEHNKHVSGSAKIAVNAASENTQVLRCLTNTLILDTELKAKANKRICLELKNINKNLNGMNENLSGIKRKLSTACYLLNNNEEYEYTPDSDQENQS